MEILAALRHKVVHKHKVLRILIEKCKGLLPLASRVVHVFLRVCTPCRAAVDQIAKQHRYKRRSVYHTYIISWQTRRNIMIAWFAGMTPQQNSPLSPIISCLQVQPIGPPGLKTDLEAGMNTRANQPLLYPNDSALGWPRDTCSWPFFDLLLRCAVYPLGLQPAGLFYTGQLRYKPGIWHIVHFIVVFVRGG